MFLHHIVVPFLFIQMPNCHNLLIVINLCSIFSRYDLAVVEVERGKFMIAEDELIQQEQRLFKEKMQIAQLRVQKEQRLAKMAGTATVKAARSAPFFIVLC